MRHIKEIKGFHYHIYFDPTTKFVAMRLRQYMIDTLGNFCVGNVHDEPIGPHTKPMFEMSSDGFISSFILESLMLNRDGLSVLIHPLTDNELEAHTDLAIWLGEKLPLNLDRL
jgi:aromatic ring-cleaving dioxygenase